MPGVTHGICQCQILFSFHNGANTTAIPGGSGSEGELKFDVGGRGPGCFVRSRIEKVPSVPGRREQLEPTMLPPRKRQKKTRLGRG